MPKLEKPESLIKGVETQNTLNKTNQGYDNKTVHAYLEELRSRNQKIRDDINRMKADLNQ